GCPTPAPRTTRCVSWPASLCGDAWILVLAVLLARLELRLPTGPVTRLPAALHELASGAGVQRRIAADFCAGLRPFAAACQCRPRERGGHRSNDSLFHVLLPVGCPACCEP